MESPNSISLEELNIRLRERIKKRGAHGIRGLSRVFRNMDDNGNKMLDKYEFSKALSEFGLGVNRAELQAIFNYYDKDSDGNISFDEFLIGLRGSLSERRKALVHKAFAKLDKDGSGLIDINDMFGVYDASKHPKVLEGEKTEKDILNEMVGNFESSSGACKDGKVTIEEFEEYYVGISSSIDLDDYFALMMCNAWGIKE